MALSISFTIKRRLFARKERLAKGNKATLISLWSRGRVTSADIGQEFRPLRLDSVTISHFDLSNEMRTTNNVEDYPISN